MKVCMLLNATLGEYIIYVDTWINYEYDNLFELKVDMQIKLTKLNNHSIYLTGSDVTYRNVVIQKN